MQTNSLLPMYRHIGITGPDGMTHVGMVTEAQTELREGIDALCGARLTGTVMIDHQGPLVCFTCRSTQRALG